MDVYMYMCVCIYIYIYVYIFIYQHLFLDTIYLRDPWLVTG